MLKIKRLQQMVIALSGTRQLELSQRHRFQLQDLMSKETASIANAKIPAGSGKPFGDDVYRLVLSAKTGVKTTYRNSATQ